MVKPQDNTNYLKEILEKYQISQTDMANKIGQSRINFNKIVNNNRKLDVETARKIGSIINRSWFELFEPIDMEITIHGEVELDYKIKLYNYIDDKPLVARLKTYLTNKEDILCFVGLETQGLYLADKVHKQSFPESISLDRKTKNGMYYTKLKNGESLIGCQYQSGFSSMKFFSNKARTTNTIPLAKKDVEYVMPICRVDFDYKRISDVSDIFN
jgi:plasmid maintenance system antidote protein VapI